jgi:pimeloyl-ACP methyl ester carboxylesterase
LAKLPDYYVMPLNQGMAEAVAPHGPSPAQIAACRWLTDPELAVYSGEFSRTGFQGGLQWYRCGTGGISARDLRLFADRKIDVPAMFIAGASDWGVYQAPGALEAMATRACSQFSGSHLIDGAGHWVQQEQPDAVVALLLRFLRA